MRNRFLLLLLPAFAGGACTRNKSTIDYRQEMRSFVQGISAKAKALHPGFIVIPQNGEQLLTSGGKADGTLAADYVAAIDGIGREDLFYGYNADDEATPAADHEEMQGLLLRAGSAGLRVLVTDYCSTPSKMDDSYAQNHQQGFISFAADHRELDNLPSYPATPFLVNTDSVATLADAKNFLYIINPGAFETKAAFLNAVAASNYDLVIMDLFFNDGDSFTASELAQLRNKPGGGTRKLVCYMSIGEAESYRYYWQPYWGSHPPSFIVAENPSWTGNFKVKYWDSDWQGIIFRNNNSYLNRVIDAGFDGVYLDIIDGFEYFEEL